MECRSLLPEAARIFGATLGQQSLRKNPYIHCIISIFMSWSGLQQYPRQETGATSQTPTREAADQKFFGFRTHF